MAYKKPGDSFLQTDVDENEMISIDMGRKNSDAPQVANVLIDVSDKIVGGSAGKYKLTLKEGRCNGCIHLDVCKFRAALDLFKNELDEVYEEAEGAKFMDVDLNMHCGYRREE